MYMSLLVQLVNTMQRQNSSTVNDCLAINNNEPQVSTNLLVFFMGNDSLSGKQVGSQASCRITL